MKEEKSLDKKLNKAAVIDLLKRYGVMTLGSILYSLGVALFLDASNLASGGVTGISIILNYVIKISTGYDLNTGIIIIILNVPLFILGAVFFGRHFIISTMYSTLLSSLLIWAWDLAFKSYLPITNNLLLAGLVGGALYGGGLGLIFRMGSSTGGTDVIVKILRKKFRYIRTGLISLTIDAAIVGVSAIVYRDIELVCYTAISIVVFTFAFDWVLYGGNTAKLIYVISTADKSKEICDRILKELDVGATFVDGEGAYTGDEKRIIMCAIKNFLYPKLRDIVKSIDPKAFVIVSSAKEIYGEGYKNHFDDEL